MQINHIAELFRGAQEPSSWELYRWAARAQIIILNRDLSFASLCRTWSRFNYSSNAYITPRFIYYEIHTAQKGFAETGKFHFRESHERKHHDVLKQLE